LPTTGRRVPLPGRCDRRYRTASSRAHQITAVLVPGLRGPNGGPQAHIANSGPTVTDGGPLLLTKGRMVAKPQNSPTGTTGVDTRTCQQSWLPRTVAKFGFVLVNCAGVHAPPVRPTLPSRSITTETPAKTVDRLDQHYKCSGCNPGKCPDTRRMVFASRIGSRDIAHDRYLCTAV
jgi:hypothetical protein